MKIIHPNHHSIRIIRKFLFFPLTIHTWSQDSGETRWLEYATIEQTYYARIGWKYTRFL